MSEFYCFQCNEKLPEPITPTDISIWVGTGLCKSCVTKQQQEDLGEEEKDEWAKHREPVNNF